MSVSLTLLPVVLAVDLTMRLVMGKDKFEAWIESLQVKMPTNFKSEGDLVRTVKKAGYDAEKWGGIIKTHFKGKEDFFIWELKDGRWVAIFSTVAKEKIKAFIKDLEKKSGRRIFLVNEETNKIEVIPTRTFPTDFRDGDLLVRALTDHGLTPSQEDTNNIIVEIGSTTLLFRKEGDSAFNVEVLNARDMQGVFNQLLLLDEDYKRCVQAVTYEKVKQRATEKNLTIESEEVLDDNSIVLTLLVNS